MNDKRIKAAKAGLALARTQIQGHSDPDIVHLVVSLTEVADLCLGHLEAARKENAELRAALRNVRALATRQKAYGAYNSKPDEFAAHLLQLCRDVGITGSLLRQQEVQG